MTVPRLKLWSWGKGRISLPSAPTRSLITPISLSPRLSKRRVRPKTNMATNLQPMRSIWLNYRSIVSFFHTKLSLDPSFRQRFLVYSHSTVSLILSQQTALGCKYDDKSYCNVYRQPTANDIIITMVIYKAFNMH